MAQSLRALAALPEAVSSVPGNHKVAHNHLLGDLMPSSGVQAHIQEEHCIHNKYMFKKQRCNIGMLLSEMKIPPVCLNKQIKLIQINILY